MFEEFRANLNLLVSKECWSFIAGPGTGSFVTLDFGPKVPRRTPLKNKTLTQEQREYRGEISLFVECSWRIDSGTEVVCSSQDDNEPGGEMLQGLKLLTGEKVEEVNVFPPALDLVLKLTGGFSLRLFCDQTNEDNYSLFSQNSVFVVGGCGKLRREARSA